jgi:hypothetical protein
MSGLDEFNRLVGYYRGRGLSESEAYGKAEESMEEPNQWQPISAHHRESLREEP